MSEAILTIREVAEYLKVTEKTVYGLAQKGKIPGFKVGGQWRFKREDIDQWIEDGKEAAVGRQEDDE
jgi:excisionase family DNA binding protein